MLLFHNKILLNTPRTQSVNLWPLARYYMKIVMALQSPTVNSRVPQIKKVKSSIPAFLAAALKAGPLNGPRRTANIK
jgi:hypothetical protein